MPLCFKHRAKNGKEPVAALPSTFVRMSVPERKVGPEAFLMGAREEGALLLDARSPSEFAEAHIGARSFPSSTMPNAPRWARCTNRSAGRRPWSAGWN